MISRESSHESAGHGQFDVVDSSTSFAIEMMVRREITVVARCPDRARHLVDVTLFDENLEISIDRPQRERRQLRQQGFVDLRGRRMGIRLLKPASDAISLSRSIAAGRRRDVIGG